MRNLLYISPAKVINFAKVNEFTRNNEAKKLVESKIIKFEDNHEPDKLCGKRCSFISWFCS